jgi:aminomethyltransferase
MQAASAVDPVGAWRAAHSGAVLVDRADLGRLFIGGKDALDLLHRLTTQSIQSLSVGQGTAAVFTTAKGRILDLVLLHRLEDGLLCLSGPGRAATVAAWIDRYTFREEVRVEDRSVSHGTLGIFGARAAACVAAIFGEDAAGRPLHHVTRVRSGGAEATLTRTFPLAGDGYHLTAEAPALPALRDRILEAPRAAGMPEAAPVPADAAVLEALRIDAGLPAAGRELSEEYNPWEARLGDAISLTKGCYVGQEVIARLNTYKKVSRYLVRLRVEGERPPAVPAPLRGGGETIGTLTSAAAVPGEGRIAALGYVRDEDAVAGAPVTVEQVDGPRPASILGLAR